MYGFFRRVFIFTVILIALSCVCATYNSYVASGFDYDVSTGIPLK